MVPLGIVRTNRLLREEFLKRLARSSPLVIQELTWLGKNLVVGRDIPADYANHLHTIVFNWPLYPQLSGLQSFRSLEHFIFKWQAPRSLAKYLSKAARASKVWLKSDIGEVCVSSIAIDMQRETKLLDSWLNYPTFPSGCTLQLEREFGPFKAFGEPGVTLVASVERKPGQVGWSPTSVKFTKEFERWDNIMMGDDWDGFSCRPGPLFFHGDFDV